MSDTENETGAGDSEEVDIGANMKAAFPAAEELGQYLSLIHISEPTRR